MTANSSERSKFIIFDRRAPTEEFKRSGHNDFATTSELKQRKFTGWREHNLIQTYELWIEGEVVRTVSFMASSADPMLLEKTAAEYFGMI